MPEDFHRRVSGDSGYGGISYRPQAGFDVSHRDHQRHGQDCTDDRAGNATGSTNEATAVSASHYVNSLPYVSRSKRLTNR